MGNFSSQEALEQQVDDGADDDELSSLNGESDPALKEHSQSGSPLVPARAHDASDSGQQPGTAPTSPDAAAARRPSKSRSSAFPFPFPGASSSSTQRARSATMKAPRRRDEQPSEAARQQAWVLDAQLLPGHRDIVRLLVQIDHERFISAADDGHIGLWNWKLGGLIARLKGHRLKITCALWMPEYHVLVSGSSDRTIRIWHLDPHLIQHTSQAEHRDDSLDFDHSSTESTSSTQTSDPSIRSPLRTIRSKNGQRGSAVGAGDSKYRLLQTFTAHSGSVTCLAAMDTMTFCSGGNDGLLKVWKLDPLHPDSPCILYSEIRRNEEEEENLHCLLYLGDGHFQRLVTGSNSNLIMVYDATENRFEKQLEGHRESICSLCKISSSLFASGSLDGKIIMWLSRTLVPYKTIDNPLDQIESKSFSWAVQQIRVWGSRYFIASMGCGFKIFDHAGDCLIEQQDGHASKLLSLAPIYRDTLLATCSADCSVRIWRPDLVHRRVHLISDIRLHTDAVNTVLSLDSSTFATCSSDCLVGIVREPLTSSLRRNSSSAMNLQKHVGHLA